METQETPKIGMLLDIAHLYGEHQGRLGPWLAVVGIGGLPAILYVYWQWYLVIPIWLFVPLNLFLVLRLLMKFPGREKHRLEIFRRQLNDEYAEAASLMNIRLIHPDGLVEYLNGTVMYLVCCFNGTSDDDVQRSVQVRKLFETMLSDFDFDIYIQNLNESQALRDYYQKLHGFGHNESATNFIGMIDHSIELVHENSMIQCTIYAIRGHKSDWPVMKGQIDSALGSKVARCYKRIYRVKDADTINEILNRDLDTVINMDTLMRQKYATQEYATSKVLAYDLPDDKVIVQGQEAQVPIIPKQTAKSFHVAYKEVE